MRVCLVERNAGTTTGGDTTIWIESLGVALARAGHDVHLLTSASPPPTLALQGVSIHSLRLVTAAGPFAGAWRDTTPDNVAWAVTAYREVARLHEERRVDVVLAPGWRGQAAACVLDRRFPTVVSCGTTLRLSLAVDRHYHPFVDLDERLALEREMLRRTRYVHAPTAAVLGRVRSAHELPELESVVVDCGLGDRVGAMESYLERVCDSHPAAPPRPSVTEALAAMIEESFEIPAKRAAAAARQLLGPPAASWRGWARVHANGVRQRSREAALTLDPKLRHVGRLAVRRDMERFVASLQLLNDTLARTELADRYWVHSGLLLGWAREGRPLAHDLKDADFGIRIEDVPRLKLAMPELIAAGFEPRLRYRNNDGCDTQYTFVHRRAKFEFFVFEQHGRLLHYNSYCGDGREPPRPLQLRHAVGAQPLCTFEFLSRTWNKPSDHDAELTGSYGDWRTPNPHWAIRDGRDIVETVAWVRGDESWWPGQGDPSGFDELGGRAMEERLR